LDWKYTGLSGAYLISDKAQKLIKRSLKKETACKNCGGKPRSRKGMSSMLHVYMLTLFLTIAIIILTSAGFVTLLADESLKEFVEFY
jgi:hypothetical protein